MIPGVLWCSSATSDKAGSYNLLAATDDWKMKAVSQAIREVVTMSEGKLYRRQFLTQSATICVAATSTWATRIGTSSFKEVRVEYPRKRIPLSFIIDDSTCLVNMGHFCTPQFATAWPQRDIYKRPWKTWPREIPDTFVRKFGQWCGEQGVKGKYSVVPNPACVGWLDRELPGWSRRDLQASVQLVRDLLLPNWDIHPEMITHTRVIDLKTGRPLKEISAATMENSYPQTKKSVDELTAYLAYALRILKNCGLPCEGITTPGGFGNAVKSELALAVQQSVRDVYQVEIPHYFKYVKGGDASTEPTLEHVKENASGAPDLTVNVPAGTGDWFGGWQGANKSEGQRYANAEATSGRMVELIQRGQPALMLCHWPGMYCNGDESGFKDFQAVVVALRQRFGNQTQWMKLSEIARYWAAKKLTKIQTQQDRIDLSAPFACPQFTISWSQAKATPPSLRNPSGEMSTLKEVKQLKDLKAGTWHHQNQRTVACFKLERGDSTIA